jgi:hypothetical protein
MKFQAKLVALIAIMSALGNVLGLLSIRLPSAPGTTVAFHLSALPALLLAVSISPLSGAITGFLSLIMATIQIGNPFIPFGNALLAGIAGVLADKFKFPPPVCAVIGELVEAPYTWFACSVYNVPQPIIGFIIVKAFIECLIAGVIIEIILLRPEVRNFLSAFKSTAK